MDDKIIEYKRGQILFTEGEQSRDLYVLQSGTVKIFKEGKDKRLPIALVQAGSFVGELSFFDGKPRSATAEAATDLRVIKLSASKLEREMKRLPGWMLVLIKSIAERLRITDDLIKRNQLIDSKTQAEFDRVLAENTKE